MHHLVRLHFKGRVFYDERPDVVAESVRVQMTLFTNEDGTLDSNAHEQASETLTLRFVFVFTCLTMVSASDLSNYTYPVNNPCILITIHSI